MLCFNQNKIFSGGKSVDRLLANINQLSDFKFREINNTINADQKHILIVEDNPGDLHLIKDHLAELKNSKYIVKTVRTLEGAKSELSKQSFDVILIDFFLPDGTCPQFISEIQKKITTPIIVLTSSESEGIVQQVLDSGASDYIPKSELNSALLERALKFAIERNRTYNLLKEQTLRDPLTGLYNRLGMEHILTDLLDNKERQSESFALLLIDIDKFKSINDTYGHSSGDTILKLISKNMQGSTRCSRKKDFPIRIAGDEFALIISEFDDIQEVQLIIDRISDKLTKAFEVDGYNITVSLSIGVALYPEDGMTTQELIKHADFSLHHAKSYFGTSYEYFDRNKHKKVQERNFITDNLSIAIEQKQFELYYQPKISTQTNQLSGFEALIRWNHPERGIIFPGSFIDIAETTGYILPIGEWVIHEACRQCREWQAERPNKISVAVNVSVRQLLHKSFSDVVEQIIQDTKIDPQCLELEVTETLIIQNLDECNRILKQLRKLGVKTSLDDFGTGYSSLSRLRMIPIDKLKIDRSLIRNVGENKFDTAIARTVLSLAKNLQVTAVAEGVETEEQYAFLKSERCAEVQGYYFSKPIPANEFYEKFILKTDVFNS